MLRRRVANGVIRGTTPAVDALAAAGIRFTRAYAPANWTVPSHASLFTGLLPHRHGVVGVRSRLPADTPTLAVQLAAGGYETVGVSENPWVNRASGLARTARRSALLPLCPT
ncbi:MAG TPA: sulfatase-like hydrolase/transferase [Candidatus Binatia bacterium]|nr:sulfatase-like hydrolase/transferase [Candidatus Binatia bacterium]